MLLANLFERRGVRTLKFGGNGLRPPASLRWRSLNRSNIFSKRSKPGKAEAIALESPAEVRTGRDVSRPAENSSCCGREAFMRGPRTLVCPGYGQRLQWGRNQRGGPTGDKEFDAATSMTEASESMVLCPTQALMAVAAGVSMPLVACQPAGKIAWVWAGPAGTPGNAAYLIGRGTASWLYRARLTRR